MLDTLQSRFKTMSILNRQLLAADAIAGVIRVRLPQTEIGNSSQLLSRQAR